MHSYWSGCILVTFGANLGIIYIEATDVINGVRYFQTFTDHFIILVIMKICPEVW